MNDLHYERIGEYLKAIRKRGWIIAAVLLFLAIAYVYGGPANTTNFRAALAALGIGNLVAIFLAVEALYERKYLLVVFLTLVSIPAMSLAYATYLEKVTGVALPSRWPPPIMDFPPSIFVIFAIAFLVGLLIAFQLIPRKGARPPPPTPQ